MQSRSDIEQYLASMLSASQADRAKQDYAETLARYLEDAIGSAELLRRQSSSEVIRRLAEDIIVSHRRTLERLRGPTGNRETDMRDLSRAAARG